MEKVQQVGDPQLENLSSCKKINKIINKIDLYGVGDERERAKDIVKHWLPSNDYQVLFEGSEVEEFWKLLGGKQPYANYERLTHPELKFPARLFHCSNASGCFKGFFFFTSFKPDDKFYYE